MLNDRAEHVEGDYAAHADKVESYGGIGVDGISGREPGTPNGVGVGLPVLWRIVIEAVSESDRPIEMVPEA